MRKYLPHILIISFVFLQTPIIQAAPDVEKRIELYKHAIRIDPDDAEAYFALGVVYVAIKDRDSALEQYEILKKLDSELANKLFNMIYE